jgi:predicted metal-dependent HD superfamily phosphohydrolase
MSTLTNPPLAIPEGLMRSVIAAYAQPPRAYHSFAHVQEVLRHYHSVPAWKHPREVYLAVLFHDAIYLAGKGDNETRSADLALQAIDTFLAGESLDTHLVRTLIELTAKHGKLDRERLDDDARHFLDCDMAILGTPAGQFDAYNAAIAEEYREVPKLIYRFNRNRFLEGLLDADRIFLSDLFHARFDAPARANLRRAVGRDH